MGKLPYIGLLAELVGPTLVKPILYVSEVNHAEQQQQQQQQQHRNRTSLHVPVAQK